jgi:hypothetical protein
VSYFDDGRVVELSELAQLLDLRAMTLAKRLQSNGRLSRRQLERVAPSGGDVGAMIAELVDVGLWTEDGGGFTRSAWLAWNDSAADVETMSKGGIAGNHLRWHVRKGVVKDDCPLCASGGVGGDVGASQGSDETRVAYSDPDLDGDVDPDSLSPVPPSTADDVDDDRESIVQRALALIAERRVKKRREAGATITSPRAYLRTVLADATEELGDELTKRATSNPEWSAEDLASMFEEPFDPYEPEMAYR